MRISRPCYDKPHRCPGWAGGGWKSSNDKHPCDGGYVTTKTLNIGWWLDHPGENQRCSTCGGDIYQKHPEHEFNGSWTGAEDDSIWCAAISSDGRKSGHRPAMEYEHPGNDKWRFGHCAGAKAGGHSYSDRTPGKGCGVVTIPWALRRLDPRWWTIYKHRVENWMRWKKGWLKK